MSEGSQLVERGKAAVSAISATKFLVYGGSKPGGALNSGYVFDVKTRSLHGILGKQNDLAFDCFSQTVWIGKQRHVTLGIDKYEKLHLV